MGMPKIIVTLDGKVLKEVPLTGERVTIGRRPYNDIVLENPAVSGEHAALVMVLGECMLEDQNSTNGTYVNGQPVRKHFLQNNDSIEIIKYRLQYVDAAHAGSKPFWANTGQPSATQQSELLPAALKVLSGANAGKTLPLTKDVTTLGRAGAQVVSITRVTGGYLLKPVEGPAPQLNKQPVGADGYALMDGDVFDLSGAQIEFVQR